MLMRVPGEVQKECLDEYLGPWMCKWVEQVPGSGPWISRVFAAKTNHFPWLKCQTPCRKKFLIGSAQLPGHCDILPLKMKSFSTSF